MAKHTVKIPGRHYRIGSRIITYHFSPAMMGPPDGSNGINESVSASDAQGSRTHRNLAPLMAQKSFLKKDFCVPVL